MNKKLALGRTGKSGWTTIDANPASRATFTEMVPPLPDAVKESKFVEIEMIHFLEHLFLWDARTLLRELDAVLEVSGYMIIECPNLEWCCRHFLGQVGTPAKGSKPGQFDMWGFYGDPTSEQSFLAHRWAWTPESLAEEIRSIGDYAINTPEARFHNPIRDFRIEAKKL